MTEADELPPLDIDEPLLGPGRLFRAVRWYFWWRSRRSRPEFAHEVRIPLFALVRNYRRPYAARRHY